MDLFRTAVKEVNRSDRDVELNDDTITLAIALKKARYRLAFDRGASVDSLVARLAKTDLLGVLLAVHSVRQAALRDEMSIAACGAISVAAEATPVRVKPKSVSRDGASGEKPPTSSKSKSKAEELSSKSKPPER